MAKLTKRTTEQLRSYLGSLSHAARDNDLRDRLLIDAAKRGAIAVDLKSFQRSIDAAVFDLAESRYGSEYTSGEWAYGVNQVAGRLGELLGAGQAAAVVTLTEHALEALVEVMERADDRDHVLWQVAGGCRAPTPPPSTYDSTAITLEAGACGQ